MATDGVRDVNMNRHTRRANKKGEQTETSASVPSPPQTAVAMARPGLLLRVFSGVLLARWVLKRVNHPDILVILRQLAQQTGRTEAAEFLSVKLRAYSH